MPYFRKYCGRGWSGRNANSTTIDFIFGSEMPSIDFKPCLEQMENSFVGRGQISPIFGPTLKIFKNWTCHFFEILHQIDNIKIFDGKKLMSRFADIFQTCLPIINSPSNAFPKSSERICHVIFSWTAR